MRVQEKEVMCCRVRNKTCNLLKNNIVDLFLTQTKKVAHPETNLIPPTLLDKRTSREIVDCVSLETGHPCLHSLERF